MPTKSPTLLLSLILADFSIGARSRPFISPFYSRSKSAVCLNQKERGDRGHGSNLTKIPSVLTFEGRLMVVDPLLLRGQRRSLMARTNTPRRIHCRQFRHRRKEKRQKQIARGAYFPPLIVPTTGFDLNSAQTLQTLRNVFPSTHSLLSFSFFFFSFATSTFLLFHGEKYRGSRVISGGKSRRCCEPRS